MHFVFQISSTLIQISLRFVHEGLTIGQCWARQWLGAEPAITLYLYWWSSMTSYALTPYVCCTLYFMCYRRVTMVVADALVPLCTRASGTIGLCRPVYAYQMCLNEWIHNRPPVAPMARGLWVMSITMSNSALSSALPVGGLYAVPAYMGPRYIDNCYAYSWFFFL